MSNSKPTNKLINSNRKVYTIDSVSSLKVDFGKNIPRNVLKIAVRVAFIKRLIGNPFECFLISTITLWVLE